MSSTIKVEKTCQHCGKKFIAQKTIKYPEMVAEIYPHFQHDKLPDFGRESLWFL